MTLPRSNLLPSIAAISRAFPLFNMKTEKAEKEQKPTELLIELHLTDSEVLNDQELESIQNISYAVRNAAKLVDMPCNIMNVGQFVEV